MTNLESQIELAKYTREIIKDPMHWTKGTYHDAERYCLMGAFYKGMAERSIRLDNRLYMFFNNQFYSTPVGYNDSHSHEEVIAALDLFIKELENEKLKAEARLVEGSL